MKFTVLTDAHGATLDDLRVTHKSLVTSGSKQVNWILLGAVPDAVKNLQRRWSFGRVKIEIQPPALGLGEFVVFLTAGDKLHRESLLVVRYCVF